MAMETILAFLSKLEKNNNKAWFDKNRKEYETTKATFEELVTELHAGLSKIEPAIADYKPKDAIFRIFRDVRFGKDKTPYKAHYSAVFSRGGKKAPDAGFYFHVEPGKSFVAGGMWQPEGPVLKKLRQEVDYNFKEFKAIISNAKFKKYFKEIEGEKLKTLPQGYTADNPAIDYLKMKSFIITAKLSDKDLTSKNGISKVVEIFAAMKPLVDFLNRSLD